MDSGLDLGGILQQAMQLEAMKRQRAAAPLSSMQEMMQYLQHDPNAQFTGPVRDAFSGAAGGVPFQQLQGAVSPIVRSARANQLRKELRQQSTAYKSQMMNNEMIMQNLLPANMPPAEKEATMKKMRAMHTLHAQNSLQDILKEYPDMMQDPMGQQLIKEFVQGFQPQTGGLDLGSIINSGPTPQQPTPGVNPQ